MAFASHHGPSNMRDMRPLKDSIENHIRAFREWYIFQGILFLFFGLLAIILPGVTALSATLLIGALLLVSGFFQLATSFIAQMHWWSLLSAALSIVVGSWMLWVPLEGILAVVMAVAIFFAVEGALEILLAIEFQHTRHWGWMLASGIATLVLSVLLFSGFPTLSVLYLGILIAVNFIFYGIAMLMLAFSIPR